MEYIALLSGIIALANEAIPQVRAMFDQGKITKEQQDKLLADYQQLRDNLDSAFSGPEWEKSGR
jgi:hypothetical protein